MLIFEQSRQGRRAQAQSPGRAAEVTDIPENLLRNAPPLMPEVSEMQAVRHYTRLSQKNFSIDTQFYPLGSCTMKYNPRACNTLAMLPGMLARHPHAPASHSQGFMACMYELQEMLKDVTGMKSVSLVPAAGAQGELGQARLGATETDERGGLVAGQGGDRRWRDAARRLLQPVRHPAPRPLGAAGRRSGAGRARCAPTGGSLAQGPGQLRPGARRNRPS